MPPASVRQTGSPVIPLASATLPATSNSLLIGQVNQDLAAFVEAYKIRAIEGKPSQAALTIPTDKTYADFLREGQALSIALHAAFPKKYYADRAIWPECLERFLADPAFQACGTGLETITDACVRGTNEIGMTRQQATLKLSQQGLQHEADYLLVAVHTARYLLDAKSIFQRQVVRAASEVFCFDIHGLIVSDIMVGFNSHLVFSSARLQSS